MRPSDILRIHESSGRLIGPRHSIILCSCWLVVQELLSCEMLVVPEDRLRGLQRTSTGGDYRIGGGPWLRVISRLRETIEMVSSDLVTIRAVRSRIHDDRSRRRVLGRVLECRR